MTDKKRPFQSDGKQPDREPIPVLDLSKYESAWRIDEETGEAFQDGGKIRKRNCENL
jgi:hypothetical protein